MTSRVILQFFTELSRASATNVLLDPSSLSSGCTVGGHGDLNDVTTKQSGVVGHVVRARPAHAGSRQSLLGVSDLHSVFDGP